MEDGRLILRSTEIEETLFGSGEEVETITDITDLVEHPISDKVMSKRVKIEITSLAVDIYMENLYAGTSLGDVYHIDIREKENPFLEERIKVSDESITSLEFLLGDVSLVVGDQDRSY